MASTRRPRPTNHAAPAAAITPDAEVWTPEMVRALGVATDVRTAARIFGISASAAYGMVARGAFPVPVIRAGGIYRVPVAAILAALHLPATDTDAAAESGADPPEPYPPTARPR